MTLKPQVKVFLLVVLIVLSLTLIGSTTYEVVNGYMRNVDNRLAVLEAQPNELRVVVSPTASPSATPTVTKVPVKRVTTVAPTVKK